MCLEGCFPLMASCDAKIVVASMEVKLGVDLCTAKLVEEVCDEWDQVPILSSDLVEILESRHRVSGYHPLLGKEYRCTHWLLG